MKKLCPGYRKTCGKEIKQGSLCSGCYKRRQKWEDPLRYTYDLKKSNAKTQTSKCFPDGVDFEISFEEWKRFWLEDHPEAWEIKKKDLWDGTKPHKHKISVDRIRSTGVYAYGNIQPMSVSDNSGKNNGEWIVNRFKFEFNPDPFTDVPF